ncbi:unnamed protein product, partial [Ilex paraguariensis]
MVEIIGNVSNSIPVILEAGDHSGKDMETSKLQDPPINDFPQVKEFPNVDRPISNNGLTIVDNPMNPLNPPALAV